ncbi:hypothetical protein BC829DRAFT_269190 [Chytridium lagenaria]|nr:hypothetical protein BC829DRAFT_269190 [Chytridium lagenaria]
MFMLNAGGGGFDSGLTSFMKGLEVENEGEVVGVVDRLRASMVSGFQAVVKRGMDVTRWAATLMKRQSDESPQGPVVIQFPPSIPSPDVPLFPSPNRPTSSVPAAAPAAAPASPAPPSSRDFTFNPDMLSEVNLPTLFFPAPSPTPVNAPPC